MSFRGGWSAKEATIVCVRNCTAANASVMCESGIACMAVLLYIESLVAVVKRNSHG